MILLTNGGLFESKMKDGITNFGSVWYNENFVPNILAWSEARKGCRITVDTADEAAVVVHKRDGAEMKFVECNTGL